MYSGTGSGIFGAHLLYDGVVKSVPITLNVLCSQLAFDLSNMRISPSADLYVLPLTDSSTLKFQVLDVANNVPNCEIIEFSLFNGQQASSSAITSVTSSASGDATTQDISIVDTHIEQEITFYPKVKIEGDFVEYLP